MRQIASLTVAIVIPALLLVACGPATPMRSLPETPQELRSYPSPPPNNHVVYEHSEEHWRISYPATWEINTYRREEYSNTSMVDADWTWELNITREDMLDWLSAGPADSYAAATRHLALVGDWDVDTPVRDAIFLGGEDVTIEGYAAYLAEYLWVPDDPGIELGRETSWVLGLFLVLGTTQYVVTLEGPPARMLTSRAEMRDIVLSFQPPENGPPVAFPALSYTSMCTTRDAIVTSDVKGDNVLNVFEDERINEAIIVIGTVTNTCNYSLDFDLVGVVYDTNGAILGTSEKSYHYWRNERDSWEDRKANYRLRPRPVFHLAPGWAEQVRFIVWLDPDEFNRAASVAILVLPP